MGEQLTEACADFLAGRQSRHELFKDYLSVRC